MRCHSLTHNGFGLCVRAVLKAQNFQLTTKIKQKMKSSIKALKQAWHKTRVICRALFHKHDWEYLGTEDDWFWHHKSDGSPCYWRKFKCKKCGQEYKEFSW